jgi:hypothetical protein
MTIERLTGVPLPLRLFAFYHALIRGANPDLSEGTAHANVSLDRAMDTLEQDSLMESAGRGANTRSHP